MVYPRLEVIIEQAATLLTFSVETGEEVQRGIFKTNQPTWSVQALKMQDFIFRSLYHLMMWPYALLKDGTTTR